MSKHHSKSYKDLLPYDTIRAASEGDTYAMNAVLQHYERYIARLSMRRLFDKNGNTYLCIDEVMRRRLEIRLIAGILAFRAT